MNFGYIVYDKSSDKPNSNASIPFLTKDVTQMYSCTIYENVSESGVTHV